MANKDPAPPDKDCERTWATIMQLAKASCLIVQAYGGTATLALPKEQRAAGIRDRVLRAHCRAETENA